MSEPIDFAKLRAAATTKTAADEPKSFTYEFELKDGERRREYGILSFGPVFVSVIRDERTPLIMFPYDRVLSITTKEDEQ